MSKRRKYPNEHPSKLNIFLDINTTVRRTRTFDEFAGNLFGKQARGGGQAPPGEIYGKIRTSL